MASEAVVDRSNILNINVGILGHVDAGKTALVRSLSTSLSTAALDKNPQSQQRGITLDLGFSAFTLPMPAHLSSDPASSAFDSIQFTLVDCPGHASLIRTIIGGAQIIDMILLVVDANKGIQTQTAECIVIGEITTDNMIVVLNKVDMIPEEERAAKLERVSNRIRKVFASTKFAGVPIVYTAAAVGGEKSTGAAASTGGVKKSPSFGVDDLVELIKSKVQIPVRNYSAPFYYAIDHCFSIKGHGTVLTGTVLSGSVSANSTIELPHLQLQRKVKSLQMFRKPVKGARQGDRVGICVTNLDASLIERGIAAAPGSVPLLQSVLCLVKKVRFFRSACKSMTKFHISIGHSTVIATAVFYGAKQLNQSSAQKKEADGAATGGTVVAKQADGGAAQHKQSALNATYQRGFPDVSYQYYDPDSASTGASTGEQAHLGYEYQDEMLSAEGLSYGTEPVQWALLQFQHPVYCPIGSLVIGSRLDADTSDKEGSAATAAATGTPSAAQQCRLAFYGPVKAALNGDAELPRTGVYTWRTKECEAFQLTDVRRGVCYEAVLWKLVSGGGSVQAFLGMRVETADKRALGTIVSSYGADGKCRVKFPTGTRLAVGEKLLFRYKRYVFDRTKRMVQTGLDQLRAGEDIPEPESFVAPKPGDAGDDEADAVAQEKAARSKGKKKEKADVAVSGKEVVDKEADQRALKSDQPGSALVREEVPDHVVVSSSAPTGPVAASPARKSPVKEFRTEPEQQPSSPPEPQPAPWPKAAPEQVTPPHPAKATPPALPVPVSTAPAASVVPSAVQTPPAPSTVAPMPVPVPVPGAEARTGTLESTKPEEPCAENGNTASVQAIVKGVFRMEENVRLYAGARAVCGAVEGTLVGPFGKLGKCKVRFPASAGACDVGSSVVVYLPVQK